MKPALIIALLFSCCTNSFSQGIVDTASVQSADASQIDALETLAREIDDRNSLVLSSDSGRMKGVEKGKVIFYRNEYYANPGNELVKAIVAQYDTSFKTVSTYYYSQGKPFKIRVDHTNGEYQSRGNCYYSKGKFIYVGNDIGLYRRTAPRNYKTAKGYYKRYNRKQ